MKTYLRFMLRILPIVLALPVEAQKVGWHPEFVNELGHGLDVRNQDIRKPLVARLETARPVQQPATGEAEIIITYAEHKLDIVRALNFNSSLSVKGVVFKGSAGVAFADTQTFSQNELNFVFEGKRDFGQRTFQYSDPTTGATPELLSTVAEWRKTIRGEALHREITARYGTHFVVGYQPVARVAVVYNFKFESATRAQSFRGSLSAQYKAADFRTQVEKFFNQSDSRITLNYRFYSSDPTKKPPFSVSGQLKTFADFLDLGAKVQDFLYSIEPESAHVRSFVVEPIQNLPGYPALVGGYRALDNFAPNYERFMEVYARLKAWQSILFEWTADARQMSWLNLAGQQTAIAIRRDLDRHLSGMEAQARTHFTSGQGLDISDDIISFFTVFNRLQLPTLNLVVAGEDGCWNHTAFGYVNCGKKDLTQEKPFLRINRFNNGVEDGEAPAIYYDLDEFQRGYQGRTGCSSLGAGFVTSQLYADLKEKSKTWRIGVFSVTVPVNSVNVPIKSLAHFSFGIKDAAGNVLESINYVTRRADPFADLLEGAYRVDVGLDVVKPPKGGEIGHSTEFTFEVMNDGPGAAYDVSVSMPIATSFEAKSVTSTHGSGVIENGNIRAHIGSLASGARSLVRVQAVPLQIGVLPLGQPVVVAANTLLTDDNSANNVVQPPLLHVGEPRLTVAPSGRAVLVNWLADTDRLTFNIEASEALGLRANWISTGLPITQDGRARQVEIPVGKAQNFVRLKISP